MLTLFESNKYSEKKVCSFVVLPNDTRQRMKIQKQPFQRVDSRKRLILLLVILSTLGILLLGTFSAKERLSTKMEPSTKVRFDEIPDTDNGVLRFVAVNTDTRNKISMKDFIHILSDPDSVDTIQSLVAILKVS